MELSKEQNMALDFLRKHGPHTMGPVESEEELAAAFAFAGLVNRGFATLTDFGNGRVQYALAGHLVARPPS